MLAFLICHYHARCNLLVIGKWGDNHHAWIEHEIEVWNAICKRAESQYEFPFAIFVISLPTITLFQYHFRLCIKSFQTYELVFVFWLNKLCYHT